jgi:L-lactate dehydrogenase complex protein LldG
MDGFPRAATDSGAVVPRLVEREPDRRAEAGLVVNGHGQWHGHGLEAERVNASSRNSRDTNAREEILARIRSALRDIPATENPDDVPVPRDYLLTHVPSDPRAEADLLAANLADYRAHVHRCTSSRLPATIARLMEQRATSSLAVPDGLPGAWLAELAAVDLVADGPQLSAHGLDAVDSVLTGCALAIAETGTIVLDSGPGQGRRALTLVPDHHVCVVFAPEQVVASVPLALARLDPARPQTWISGPSATSDIELDRVEGVHGPRLLDVIIVAEG